MPKRASIGINIYDEKEKVESFDKHAKLALIRAKKEGKNRFQFYSYNLDIQHYKEIQLKSDLYNVIKNDQLRLYYQPIVSIKTNQIIAAEALIRWDHPEWGIVHPDEFINLAIENGIFVHMSDWVLREACKNYKKWQEKHPKLKVSVNFASIEFLEKSFAENIEKTIKEFGLDPSFLIIELKENAFIENPERIISHINRLGESGVNIALDDFGTGYSSLAYLVSFNIDFLKLDKYFIKDTRNPVSRNIVKNTIKMANELRVKLVAEGIENWDQINALQEFNCFAGQGYIYTEPVAAEEFEKILDKKICPPKIVEDRRPKKDRRKFFRVNFYQLLEAKMTIKEIARKKVSMGNTNILIKNIGPGGLSFISDIILPTNKELVLQFKTELLETEIKAYGKLVWTNNYNDKLQEYGVEFLVDEEERSQLVKILNQVQIKMKADMLFADGSFTSDPPTRYFNTSD